MPIKLIPADAYFSQSIAIPDLPVIHHHECVGSPSVRDVADYDTLIVARKLTGATYYADPTAGWRQRPDGDGCRVLAAFAHVKIRSVV